MLACVYVVAFVGVLTAGLVFAHTAIHQFSALQAFLALFEVVNLLICIWEIALFSYATKVAKEYRGFREKYGVNGELPRPMILFQDITLDQAISLEFWSTIWSTYALMDPAYQDCTSFGFWIDTGNGITTLIPTVLAAIGMTWDVMPPRVLGLISFVVHYQEFYGTVIYFSQYLYNEKYVGQPLLNKTIVATSNAFWIIAPAIAMWTFYTLIDTNNADIFRT
eukprot:m.72588 g.72588  ORF g.72588 m.72588 type:complete len:222 (-) comp18738_c0_seq1:226-891(-)